MSTDHTSESSFDTSSGFVVPNIDPDKKGDSFDNAEAVGSRESAANESEDMQSHSSAPVAEYPIANEELEQGDRCNSDGTILGTTAIEFRVLRAGAPVRRLRLTGNRYTFGSAEGCSIRLTDHALRPMHAVLIRDHARLVIRAYSVPVEVNGTRTTEASLQLGDVLRLGAYQFELTTADSEPSLASSDEFPTSQRSVFDPPGTRFQSSPIDWVAGRSSVPNPSDRGPARKELPPAEDVIWRERLRREIDQWRDRQADCDQRESRIDERESDLRGRESELWTRAENLYRRESRLQAQETAAFQLYEDYSQRQEELISLRESAHQRQQELQARESEFRSQEFEYRRRLEEATRQLQQSQQQAESATEAVQRMREQFESLNSQIDELSGQQNDIEHRETRQREEHERLRRDLESARDKAIDAQAESEARRREAEQRVEEMSVQIEALQAGEGVDVEKQNQKLQESEELNEKLSQQIEELQRSVADASEEAAQLRQDYEEAQNSVAQLETLVEQSKERGDSDRDSWSAEADELRDAVDQLSVELARANSELSELREANNAINARLEGVQLERDEAIADAQSRPTTDAFESLRDELDAANQQLAQMKQDYEETLTRLENADSNSEAINEDVKQEEESPSTLSLGLMGSSSEESSEDHASLQDNADEDDGAWPTYESSNEVQASDEAQADGANSSDVYSSSEIDEPSYENSLDTPSESANEDVWGQDQPVNSSADHDAESNESVVWNTSSWNDSADSDSSDSRLQEDSQSDSTFSDSNPWANSESSESPDSDSVEMTSAWNSTPTDETAGPDSDAVSSADWDNSDDQESDPAEMTSVWNREDEHEQSALPLESRDDEPMENSILQGSLASQLIQDLDSDTDPPEENTFVMDQPGDAPSQASWDQEYPEESIANQWSNDDEGYRVEEVDDSASSYLDSDEVSQAAENDQSEEVPSSDEAYDNNGYEEYSNGTDDSSPEASAFNEESSAESTPEPAADEPSATSEEDLVDDDSIEAYMNRLLKRSGGAAEPQEPETETATLATSQTNLLTDSTSELIDSETAPPIDPDAPLVPRSQAPEKTSDLSAMRELANASARSAIGRSVRIKTRNMQIQGMVSFACAIGALCCIGAAAFFLSGILLYVGVAMLCLIAGVCAWEGMQSFAQAQQRLRAAEAGELDEEDEELEEPSAEIAQESPEIDPAKE